MHCRKLFLIVLTNIIGIIYFIVLSLILFWLIRGKVYSYAKKKSLTNIKKIVKIGFRPKPKKPIQINLKNRIM